MRIFLISDVHVDFSENAKWLTQISDTDFKQDALILAGDVAHHFKKLQETLLRIDTKFKDIFFVPGNHDLWIHNSDWPDSIEKFLAIQHWCSEIGIHMNPKKLGAEDPNPVWIVPLLSWYSDFGDGPDSLFIEKPGEDPESRMWSDRYYIKWPSKNNGFKASAYFSSLNENDLQKEYDSPVISFSHFLPRQETIFGESMKPDPEKVRKYDRNPKFNFSRVAGSALIEKQIRNLDSIIHAYGHQHINRDREIESIWYVSHCLGYPKERKRGTIKGIDRVLKLIWDTNKKIT